MELNNTTTHEGPLSMRAGRTRADQPRTKQFFDWGHVNWLVEPKGLGSERISVGEIVFYPHRGEPEHDHFGEEHILHVISGSGYQTVNGHMTPLSQGDTIYIKPYSSHALINNSADDLRLLCVYCPVRLKPALLNANDSYIDVDDEMIDLAAVLDRGITERLLNRLSQALDLSLRLLDAKGQCIVQSEKLPQLCRKMGQQGDYCRGHINNALSGLASNKSIHFCFCCGRVSSIIIPIYSGKNICGYLKCGEFFITPDDQAAMLRQLRDQMLKNESADEYLSDIEIEKKSRLYSAAEATLAIAGYIVENSQAMLRQKELDENRLSIINEQVNAANLEKALREADFKLLQSQINPHFLFNTLNIISQLAYMEGADNVASLVCSLAELMRATLRKANVLIPLKEEIALLKDYLHIQKTRFGQRLNSSIEVEEGLDEVSIPILILQPLVENAIVHGVELNMSDCRIDVLVKRAAGGRVSLSVNDNGPGFQDGLSFERNGLGLKSIKARLKHFFDDQYTFDLKSQPGQGAFIEITIPEKISDNGHKNSGG